MEAGTKEEAVEQVQRSLIEAMDVRATAAERHLAATYQKLGPIQRRNMLTKLDGLTNPAERQESKAALRQLTRAVEREKEEAAWISSALADAPPISPETADRLARLLEVRHVEKNYNELPSWDRHSPIHSEE